VTSSAPASPGTVPEMDAVELGRLGITLVSTESYQVGPYRYGSLADALAEAKRGRARGDQA